MFEMKGAPGCVLGVPGRDRRGCVWGVVTPGLVLGSEQKASVTSPAPCVLHMFMPVHTHVLAHAKLDRVPQTEGTGLCWPRSSCFCTSRLKTCLLGVLGRQLLRSGFGLVLPRAS